MPYLTFFFWGILAAIGALGLELAARELYYIISSPGSYGSEIIFHALPLLLLVAVTEEIFKFLIIYKRVISFFSKKRKIIAGSFFVGLGFALTEAALIAGRLGSSWTENIKNILEISLLQILTAVLAGAIIVFLVRSGEEKPTLVFLAPAAAATAHFLFNYLALKNEQLPEWAIPAYLGLLFLVCLSLAAGRPKNLQK